MTILLLILTLINYCSSDNNTWFAWRQESNEKTEAIIKENLHLIDFLPTEDIDLYLKNFHLVDIDLDSDYDIVYLGWSGAEPDCLRFWINKNDSFVESAFIWGELKNANQTSKLKYDLDVNLPGCCGDFEIKDYDYEMIVTKDSIEINIKDINIHHESTVIPDEQFDKPIIFRVTNNQYNLRITPEIDTTNCFFPGDSPNGNIYQVYKSGDTGKAFSEKADSTGRIWWFVEMDSNKSHSRHDNGIQVLPKFSGWMSNRYLEKK